jgi:purine-binding chemotaxis protein CheW
VKSLDRHAAASGPKSALPDASYLRVRLGQEHFALPIADVAVVIARGELRAVPGASQALLGVVNRRGKVLPIFDLALALGLGAGVGTTRVVVVEDGDRRAGLAVDEVLGIGPLPALENAPSRLLQGTTLVDGALVGVLDMGRLLDALQEGEAS